MLRGILGKKLGMSQFFHGLKVIPVTAIDIGNWYVIGMKKKEKDGYDALQVGLLKERYRTKPFLQEWLKKPDNYFSGIKEIKYDETVEAQVGQPVDFLESISLGQAVDVFGTTKGHGFQGVVKRHGFSGGGASHGPRFGRIPGSMGFMRSKGRVIKGKRLPGHMGVAHRAMKNLEIVHIEPNAKVILVKGSIPGSSGSFVYVQKVR